MVVSLGTFIVIDGTLTYLATGPVIVGHSLIVWVLLELELLEHWNSGLLLHSGSARPAPLSGLSPATVLCWWSPWPAWHLVWSAWSSAWHLLCSGWSIPAAELPSVVVISLGTVIFTDGTLTYLATGPVIVGHSLMVWVLLELELLEHWNSGLLLH